MTMKFEDFKKGMEDKVAEKVVDTFLRKSEVLQLMPFDNCVSPTGGSTLTYAYMQTLLPSTAGFRALNTEYTSNEATMERKTADLKIFGGKFSMDRVLKQAEGKYNNMAFQMEQKIAAAVSLLHYTMINGNSTTTTEEFDGLDKMLVGTTTEFNADGSVDLSTIDAIKSNADQFYEMLRKLVRTTSADALLMNTEMIGKIETVARILGYKTETEEAFGKKVTSMDDVRFIDLQNHYTVSENVATSKPIVGIEGGLTDIYAVKFDVNEGFHGVTLTGNSGLSTYLPDFGKPGAVKDGEVEMVGATVLKKTQHAGVLRNVKIAAA